VKVVRGRPEQWQAHRSDRAVTVGVYDGVHLGHRHVFDLLSQRAADLGGLETAVVTFDPHPLAVVDPERTPPLLTTIDHRLELFAGLGVDLAAVMEFDESIRSLTAAGFAADVLQGVLGARLVVVGEDFRFGRDRIGNVASLAELGDGHGFAAEIAPLAGGDQPLSSTMVRELLSAGEVAAAADALGRPHELWGEVGTGDGRGQEIGFPTANVALPSGLAIPRRGVYAVRTRWGGESWRDGVANIGVRPTFAGDEEVLEVHLLDGRPDLYGTELRVAFVARLRAERRFDGIAALVAQIEADVDAARAVLAGAQES
jgi:riboflavin kinase/FMN adenylyltransferase